MSERGVFAVDRGIWDHDLFFDGEPLSRREAWLWLVSEAAWKERTRRIIGRQNELQRGQLVASLRFIASKWGWTEPRVRRFLAALTSEQMIDAKTDAGVTVITICNYDSYQRVSLPTDATRESDSDAATTQQRRNTEDIKTIEGNSLRSAKPEIDDGWPTDFREQFWARYPHKVGRPKAIAKLEGCRKRGVPWLDIWDGLLRYIREKPPDRSWLNPETFLNQERWADEPAKIDGQRISNNRPDTAAGRATAREAQQVAAVGGGALSFLRESKAAGTGRDTPGSSDLATVYDLGKRAENAR